MKLITLLYMSLAIANIAYAQNDSSVVNIYGETLSKKTYIFEKCGLELIIRSDKTIVATEYLTTTKFEKTDSSDSIGFENVSKFEKGLRFDQASKSVDGNFLKYVGKNGKMTLTLTMIENEEGHAKFIRHEVSKKKLFGGEKIVSECDYR